jgi:hypothetical protein
MSLVAARRDGFVIEKLQKVLRVVEFEEFSEFDMI